MFFKTSCYHLTKHARKPKHIQVTTGQTCWILALQLRNDEAFGKVLGIQSIDEDLIGFGWSSIVGNLKGQRLD